MASAYTTTKHLLEQSPALYRTLLKGYERYFATQMRMALTMRQQTPILIYQMGKVGSSSILQSLQAQPNLYPIHVHYIFPENVRWRQQLRQQKNTPERAVMYRGIPIYRQLIQAERPVKIITPVREPIGRNLSFFFQVFELYTGVSHQHSNLSIDELCEIFLRKNEHDLAINWFDIEFQKALGVDVYAYEFPREDGFLRIQHGNLDILLFKAEIDDSLKEDTLADFLNWPHFRLAQANVSENKAYAETYKAFKKQLVLPENYLNSMLNSRYTQHFYTSTERDSIREKWQSRLPDFTPMQS